MKFLKNILKLIFFISSSFLIISCGSGLNFFDQPSSGQCGAYPDQYIFYDEIGSGLTSADPYIICNAHQLVDLAYENSSSSVYDFIALGKNIDYAADGYASTISIGENGMPFKGNFDGRGFTIYNLYQNNTAGSHMGLFGKTDGAVLKNIRFSNLYVGGSSYLGALVGEAIDTNVENISVSSDSIVSGLNITGATANIGGVIGYAGGTGSIIQNITSHADVTVLEGSASLNEPNIGGLVGICVNCALSDSIMTGDITAVNTTSRLLNIGGAVGLVYEGGLLFRIRVSIDNINLSNSGTSGLYSHVAGLVGSVYTTNLFIEIRDFEVNINDIIHVSNATGNSRVAGIVGRIYSSAGMNVELGRGYFMGNITSNSSHSNDEVAGIVSENNKAGGGNISVSNIFTNANINYASGTPERIVKSNFGGGT
jgi:hypothetical protein